MLNNWWVVKQMADARMADLEKEIAGMRQAKVVRSASAANKENRSRLLQLARQGIGRGLAVLRRGVTT